MKPNWPQYLLILLLPCIQGEDDEDQDRFVDLINSKNASWTAKALNPDLKKMIDTIMRLNEGAISPYRKDYVKILYHNATNIALPKIFNAVDKWESCKEIIGQIRNQGNCDSSWGAAVAGVISDRTCIGSNGTIKFHASAEDLVTCCTYCSVRRHSCKYSWAYRVWRYWVKYGVVSGGMFKESEGCKPYSAALFNDSKHVDCITSCTNGDYPTPYEEDKHYGKTIYLLPKNDEVQIQREIYENGPVVALMDINEDLIFYQKGVYSHLAGKRLGSQFIRIVGWGVMNEKKFWKVSNSFGEDWGYKGYSYIVRGINHCRIEEEVRAGKITGLSAGEKLIDNPEYQKNSSDGKRSLWIVCSLLVVVVFLASKLHY